jgi:hypothetical protein
LSYSRAPRTTEAGSLAFAKGAMSAATNKATQVENVARFIVQFLLLIQLVTKTLMCTPVLFAKNRLPNLTHSPFVDQHQHYP